jgi:hypothetical protein
MANLTCLSYHSQMEVDGLANELLYLFSAVINKIHEHIQACTNAGQQSV